jgi:hypothetical protein
MRKQEIILGERYAIGRAGSEPREAGVRCGEVIADLGFGLWRVRFDKPLVSVGDMFFDAESVSPLTRQRYTATRVHTVYSRSILAPWQTWQAKVAEAAARRRREEERLAEEQRIVAQAKRAIASWLAGQGIAPESYSAASCIYVSGPGGMTKQLRLTLTLDVQAAEALAGSLAGGRETEETPAGCAHGDALQTLLGDSLEHAASDR